MNFTPSAYLFDIGNVIVHFDFGLAIGRVADQCSLAPVDILPVLQPFTDQFETGTLDVAEFVARASEKIGFSGDAAEFIAAFEDIFELNEPIADLIAEISEAGTPLYLLSNTNAIHVPYFTNKYPVFQHFEGGIYSHEVGCMKPAPQIYAAAIEKFNLDPATTAYVDDLAANCEAGEKAGLQAFRYDFRDHAALLAALRSPV